MSLRYLQGMAAQLFREKAAVAQSKAPQVSKDRLGHILSPLKKKP